MMKQSKANTEYNAGVVADQKASEGINFTARNGAKRQLYRCLTCGYRFMLGEDGFSKVSSDPHVIVEALNLLMGGMSCRYIARHLLSKHQVKISHFAIIKWVRKYTQLMKDYVDKSIPEYQEVWSVDEMMVNVKNAHPMRKGYYSWIYLVRFYTHIHNVHLSNA